MRCNVNPSQTLSIAYSVEVTSPDARVDALEALFDGLPRTLSVSEAAAVLNVSVHIIRSALTDTNGANRLPAVRLANSWVILTEDYRRWTRQRYTGADD